MVTGKHCKSEDMVPMNYDKHYGRIQIETLSDSYVLAVLGGVATAKMISAKRQQLLIKRTLNRSFIPCEI